MAETKQEPTFESTLTFKADVLKAAPFRLPAKEEIAPSKFAHLNVKQCKEMTIKLIEFLKLF